MNDITSFERYLKNQQKKKKQAEDQKILDQMMNELKKKCEQQHKEKVTKTKDELMRLIKGG